MSVMDVIRRPTIGMRIEYTYGDTPGIIEVVNVTEEQIFFRDHFNNVYRDQIVKFGWGTWKMHINSTLKIVSVLSNEPDWEI